MKHLIVVLGLFLIGCAASIEAKPEANLLSPHASVEVSKATTDDSTVEFKSDGNIDGGQININELHIGGAGVLLVSLTILIGYLWVKKSRFYKVAKLLIETIEHQPGPNALKTVAAWKSQNVYLDKTLKALVKKITHPNLPK